MQGIFAAVIAAGVTLFLYFAENERQASQRSYERRMATHDAIVELSFLRYYATYRVYHSFKPDADDTNPEIKSMILADYKEALRKWNIQFNVLEPKCSRYFDEDTIRHFWDVFQALAAYHSQVTGPLIRGEPQPETVTLEAGEFPPKKALDEIHKSITALSGRMLDQAEGT